MTFSFLPVMLGFCFCFQPGTASVFLLQGEEQVKQIAESPQDEDPLVRKLAANALGLLGPEAKAAIPFLVQVLGDDSLQVRSAAAKALVQYGEAGVSALIEVLNSEDIYVRQSAVRAFKDMRPLPPTAVSALTALIDDKNTKVSDGAYAALMRAKVHGELKSDTHEELEARYQTAKKERQAREKASQEQ